MVKQGLLDKYGKKTDKTPADWRTNYADYNTEQKPETTTESMDVNATLQANGSPGSEKESNPSSEEEEEEAPKKKKKVNAVKF